MIESRDDTRMTEKGREHGVFCLINSIKVMRSSYFDLTAHISHYIFLKKFGISYLNPEMMQEDSDAVVNTDLSSMKSTYAVNLTDLLE